MLISFSFPFGSRNRLACCYLTMPDKPTSKFSKSPIHWRQRGRKSNIKPLNEISDWALNPESTSCRTKRHLITRQGLVYLGAFTLACDSLKLKWMKRWRVAEEDLLCSCDTLLLRGLSSNPIMQPLNYYTSLSLEQFFLWNKVAKFNGFRQRVSWGTLAASWGINHRIGRLCYVWSITIKQNELIFSEQTAPYLNIRI